MFRKLLSVTSILLSLLALAPDACADSINNNAAAAARKTLSSSMQPRPLRAFELSTPTNFVTPYLFTCCGRTRGPVDDFEATFLGVINVLLVGGVTGCNTTASAMMVSIICPNGIQKGDTIKLIPLDSSNHRVKLGSACWSFSGGGTGAAGGSCVGRAIAAPEPPSAILAITGLALFLLFGRRRLIFGAKTLPTHFPART